MSILKLLGSIIYSLFIVVCVVILLAQFGLPQLPALVIVVAYGGAVILLIQVLLGGNEPFGIRLGYASFILLCIVGLLVLRILDVSTALYF